MIRLRFVTDDSLVSRIIRSAQLGFWASHVEAVFADGYLGAHFQGGVMLRPADYDAGGRTREEFADVACTDVQAAAFERYLRAQLGKPYDLWAIGQMAEGVLAATSPADDGSSGFICSYLTGCGLVAAGLARCLPARRLTTPRDNAHIVLGRAL